MAPYANIIFVHPPVPETIGIQGWPQVAQAIEMIADQHLANVITVSLGDGENDFINDPTNPTATQAAAVHSLDPAFLDAAAHNVPVMFASGDCGPTDPTVLERHRPVHPADRRHRGPPGRQPVGHRRRRHDPQRWPRHGGRADRAGRAVDRTEQQLRRGGRGVSTIYPKPSCQRGHPGPRRRHRPRRPDIAMDASDGTSQASPTFAGVMALATQLRGGRDLGTVNPALAAIGPRAPRRASSTFRRASPTPLTASPASRPGPATTSRRAGARSTRPTSCRALFARSTGRSGRSSRAGSRSSS